MQSTQKKGFTLIELLIVVVIIGILAAIAIPKFASTKAKAYIAAMKTDLRNLVTAEEGYFSDYQAFTNNTGATGLNFSPSLNVNINAGTITVDPNNAGWKSTATHNLVPNKTCEVQVGNQVAAGQKDGVPFCY